MAQSMTPATPGVPAPMNTVWPPSNPSGTVIPFPLPWGQTGCCPPGGLDALMKCYCDIQQASAFIGQVMLDQINNNPAIIAAIIAGIEKSGSALPTIGVTNGAPAQPGQVGEYQLLLYNGTFTTGTQNQVFSAGVLPPGDWLVQTYSLPVPPVTYMLSQLTSQVGFSTDLVAFISDPSGAVNQLVLSQPAQLLASVPTLMAFAMETIASAGGSFTFGVEAWRMR